jgi:hypothetical protein
VRPRSRTAARPTTSSTCLMTSIRPVPCPPRRRRRREVGRLRRLRVPAVRPGGSRVNGFEIFAHPTELELLHPRARTRVKRAPGSFDRGGAMRQPRAGTRTQDGGHDGRRLWAYRFRPGGRDIPSPTSPRCKPSTPKVPRRRPLIRTANVTVALLLSPERSAGDQVRGRLCRACKSRRLRQDALELWSDTQ